MINPHNLFIVLTLLSVGLLIAALSASGDVEPIYGMMRIFLVTLAIIGVVLFVTRRYWRHARRLV